MYCYGYNRWLIDALYVNLGTRTMPFPCACSNNYSITWRLHALILSDRSRMVHCLLVIFLGFVTHIERLFDENILIGKGWTAHESMRPLAYSTLADLVHHVRTSLPMSELALAVDLFSKNIHDDSLPSSIQTMSCKLLLNLVESIKTKSDQDNGNVRAYVYTFTCSHMLCVIMVF